MQKRYLFAPLFAAALAAPIFLQGQKPAEMPTWQAEKCYGIAKAGQNDCASTGNNSCGGTSKANADKKAWLFVPAGYCERIVGGSKTAK